MKISRSLSRDTHPASHNVFATIYINSISELPPIITEHNWSPNVWRGGHRATKNFASCELLVLDFDDGRFSIADAVSWCKKYNYQYLLGTTKSHQKQKGGLPPCDRFRLVMLWETAITCPKTLRQNYERILNILPADRACKDAARTFMPCVEVVACGAGKPIYVAPYRAVTRPVVDQTHWAKNRLLPEWVKLLLRTPAQEGERNKTCFRLGAVLTRLGYSESDVINLVLNTPIDLPAEEKRNAAKSGIRAERG